MSQSLVTVTIGRNIDDVPMSDYLWTSFQTAIKDFLTILPDAEVFGPFNGMGEWEGITEESVTFTALTSHSYLPEAADAIETVLSDAAGLYSQDAIAWSYGPARLAKGR